MWLIARLFDDHWRAISVDGASVPAVGSGINGDDRPDARLLIAVSEPIMGLDPNLGTLAQLCIDFD